MSLLEDLRAPALLLPMSKKCPAKHMAHRTPESSVEEIDPREKEELMKEVQCRVMRW